MVQRSSSEKPCVKSLINWLRMLRLKLSRTSKRKPDTKGPTIKQKAVFILRTRRTKKAQVKTFAEAFDVVDGLIGNLARSVYTRSSVAVHVADCREEARKVRDYVSLVLAELLEIGD